MGNQNYNNFDPKDWDSSPLPADRHLLQNKKTRKKLERSIVRFADHQEFNRQKEIYEKRMTCPENIVKVVHMTPQQQRFLCSECIRAQVVVQHVTTRLNDLADLSQDKAIFILHEALKGFKFLQQNSTELFQIHPSMVAVSQFDEVKVWIHQDFTVNHPLHGLQNQFRNDQEHRNVDKLFNLIRQSIKGKQFSTEFMFFKKSMLRPPFSYQSAIRTIKEYAAISTGTNLPTQFYQEKQVQRPVYQPIPQSLFYYKKQNSQGERPTSSIVSATKLSKSRQRLSFNNQSKITKKTSLNNSFQNQVRLSLERPQTALADYKLQTMQQYPPIPKSARSNFQSDKAYKSKFEPVVRQVSTGQRKNQIKPSFTVSPLTTPVTSPAITPRNNIPRPPIRPQVVLQTKQSSKQHQKPPLPSFKPQVYKTNQKANLSFRPQKPLQTFLEKPLQTFKFNQRNPQFHKQPQNHTQIPKLRQKTPQLYRLNQPTALYPLHQSPLNNSFQSIKPSEGKSRSISSQITKKYQQLSSQPIYRPLISLKSTSQHANIHTNIKTSNAQIPVKNRQFQSKEIKTYLPQSHFKPTSSVDRPKLPQANLQLPTQYPKIQISAPPIPRPIPFLKLQIPIPAKTPSSQQITPRNEQPIKLSTPQKKEHSTDISQSNHKDNHLADQPQPSPFNSKLNVLSPSSPFTQKKPLDMTFNKPSQHNTLISQINLFKQQLADHYQVPKSQSIKLNQAPVQLPPRVRIHHFRDTEGDLEVLEEEEYQFFNQESQDD